MNSRVRALWISGLPHEMLIRAPGLRNRTASAPLKQGPDEAPLLPPHPVPGEPSSPVHQAPGFLSMEPVRDSVLGGMDDEHFALLRQRLNDALATLTRVLRLIKHPPSPPTKDAPRESGNDPEDDA